ncbi:hypothetical protein BXY85_3086 [Roseivirga pacifica]|uniref:Uncharacterized protein n=1 Tax=Roseivirga pacifica TaxID=1267423 RepID=A0A1I0QWD3_9BACT|nr:hypothetical protein BXY85_3086 [Roseivirga pacifica]SEW31809.1 hypothetical protein SAMN05216290_2787 [Roseivirga pacifica]
MRSDFQSFHELLIAKRHKLEHVHGINLQPLQSESSTSNSYLIALKDQLFTTERILNEII